jgi:uncharacterized protein YndB with AHSA1/START domain
MMIRFAIGAVVLVGVLLTLVGTRPSRFKVARSITIDAPPEAVFAEVNDFHHWKAWNPWAAMDPAMRETYEGASAGVGAVYRWSGDARVGEGRMRISESQPGQLIRIDLQFLRPLRGTSTAEFRFEPEAGRTRVTWAMTGENGLIAKVVHLIMNMDRMVGGQFERGLAGLKAGVEATAAARSAPPRG